MCRIEQFDVVYPNGFRERREKLVACPRGTRSQPCRHAEIVRVADRLASASDLRALAQPRVVPIEPRDLEPSRPHSRGSVGRRGPIEGITLDFKLWNPFSSKNKKKKEKTEYYIERRSRRQDPRPAGFQHHIPMPPPPPHFQHHIPMPPPPPQMHMRPPVREESPVIIPIHPPEHHPNQHRPEREPRRRRRRPPTPIIIQHYEEDEDESSSPPQANREHRRTRSLSPNTRYEVEKEIIRIRELDERIRRERIIREERENREERQRQREEQRERRAEARREARRREARIQQEHEDRERIRAEARARRHREEQNTARRRAADLERQLRQEEEDNERRDELRRRRDAEIRYQYAEQRRRARARQANVPLAPRHPVDIHRDEGHVDRGERFIRSAIRAENVRQFDRRAGWPR